MRKNVFIFMMLFFLFCRVYPQQKLAFSFGETPQTLMLNPGAETAFKYHFGFPLLSNISLNGGFTGFQLNDLFANDGVNFTTKFQRVLNRLDERDFLTLQAKIDVLNGGFRWDDKTYMSFGFYEEFDFIGYMPKDIADLLYYGNAPFLNRSFSLSHVTFKADVMGVLHFGISRKVSDRLSVGGRLKIYSSSLNIESTSNSGTYTTARSNVNLYQHILNNVDGQIRTSGLIDQNNQLLQNPLDLLTKTFLGGNLGLGFDFGITYHFTPQFEFTGSILDLGFVRHTKGTKNYSAEGNYVFNGIQLTDFNANPPIDYWQLLSDDFKANVPNREDNNSYTSWRPTQFNAALKYSFGEIRRKECYTTTYKEYYRNAFGFQVHSIFRPLGPLLSLTSFYERSLGKNFHTKFTHTMNAHSYLILGSGMSFQLGRLNIFGMLDNILGLVNVGNSNNFSLNFGVNFVIK